jgi:uncharacterized membrane protein
MMKKDKKRVLLIGVGALLFVSTLVLFAMTSIKIGNVIIGAGSIIIAVVVAIFAAFIITRKYDSVKKGFPLEDERTKNIMQLAGYRAFLVSIYWLLALSWLSDDWITFRDPSQALGMGILGMAIIFGLSWLYTSARGEK